MVMPSARFWHGIFGILLIEITSAWWVTPCVVVSFRLFSPARLAPTADVQDLGIVYLVVPTRLKRSMRSSEGGWVDR